MELASTGGCGDEVVVGFRKALNSWTTDPQIEAEKDENCPTSLI